MIKIRLPQAGAHSPRLVHPVNIEKIKETGHHLNLIISTGYAAMVNSATNFIVEYLADLKRMPICRNTLKSYVNKTTAGIKKFDLNFKYEFPNLKVWQNNLDLTDAISDKIEPTCKGMYFAISNELG